MTIWVAIIVAVVIVAGLIAGRNRRRVGGADGKLGDFALSDDERALLNAIYQLCQGNTEQLINRENVVEAARFESSFGERLLSALKRQHLIRYVPIGCLCITEAGVVCASSSWRDDQAATETDAAEPALATLASSEVPPPDVDEDTFQQWLAANGLLHEHLSPDQMNDLRHQFAGGG